MLSGDLGAGKVRGAWQVIDGHGGVEGEGRNAMVAGDDAGEAVAVAVVKWCVRLKRGLRGLAGTRRRRVDDG